MIFIKDPVCSTQYREHALKEQGTRGWGPTGGLCKPALFSQELRLAGELGSLPPWPQAQWPGSALSITAG